MLPPVKSHFPKKTDFWKNAHFGGNSSRHEETDEMTPERD
jgi:hypothetical protein